VPAQPTSKTVANASPVRRKFMDISLFLIVGS